jgi:hypothetical protein
LLPLAAGTGIFLLVKNSTAPILLVAIGLFGATVTIGLFFYEFRGMRECELLRERGANLERELKLTKDCSRFQGYMPGVVGPLWAGPIVYFAVVAGWLFVAIYRIGASRPRLEKTLGLSIIVAYLIVVGTVCILFHNDAKRRSRDEERALLSGARKTCLYTLMNSWQHWHLCSLLRRANSASAQS